MPGDIQKQAIGPHCPGCVGLALNNKTLSGAAHAIVTFHDLAAAFKAFEELAMAKFNHGKGLMLWANVKWFRGKPLANVQGSMAMNTCIASHIYMYIYRYGNGSIYVCAICPAASCPWTTWPWAQPHRASSI